MYAAARDAASIDMEGAVPIELDITRPGHLARQEMETNFVGPLAMSRAFAPLLAANGGGAIINVPSVLSWINIPGTATYSAPKAAAWSMTNGLREALRGQGTQVIGLHVGFMDTDMTRGLDVPKASLGAAIVKFQVHCRTGN